MKNSIIFALFCLSLLMFGCGDGGKSEKTAENGNESGRKTGSLYGECYPNETCNKGLECDVENNICLENQDKTDSGTEPTDTGDSDISQPDTEPVDTGNTGADTDTDTDTDADTSDTDANADPKCASKYKCAGNNSMRCTGGVWDLEESCTYSCDYSTGKCKPAECTEGQYKCEGIKDSALCENGSWHTISCEAGCEESTGKCMDSCYNDIGNNDNKLWSLKSSASCNWEEAVEYCDNLVSCGYDDWRLPTINELRTLIQNCPDTEPDGACEVNDPACLSYSCRTDPCATGCSSSHGSKLGDYDFLWSSSTVSDLLNAAWSVCFSNGSVFYASKDDDGKTNYSYVRCVRNSD